MHPAGLVHLAGLGSRWRACDAPGALSREELAQLVAACGVADYPSAQVARLEVANGGNPRRALELVRQVGDSEEVVDDIFGLGFCLLQILSLT